MHKVLCSLALLAALCCSASAIRCWAHDFRSPEAAYERRCPLVDYCQTETIKLVNRPDGVAQHLIDMVDKPQRMCGTKDCEEQGAVGTCKTFTLHNITSRLCCCDTDFCNLEGGPPTGESTTAATTAAGTSTSAATTAPADWTSTTPATTTDTAPRRTSTPAEKPSPESEGGPRTEPTTTPPPLTVRSTANVTDGAAAVGGQAVAPGALCALALAALGAL